MHELCIRILRSKDDVWIHMGCCGNDTFVVLPRLHVLHDTKDDTMAERGVRRDTAQYDVQKDCRKSH